MVALERDLPAPGSTAGITADAIPLALRRHGGSPRQVLAIALVGTMVLAVFASRELSSWLNRMGDGPLLVPLQHAAATWDRAMASVGLTRPADVLRATIARLIDWQWGEPP